jgi:hypothetical protein
MRMNYRAVEGCDKQHRERGLTGFSSVNFAQSHRMKRFSVQAEPKMH